MVICDVNKLIKYWSQGSDLDFKAAQEIIHKTQQYVNVLFMLHLSLEKALKAVYVYKFQDHAPYTHNLIQLATKLELDIEDRITFSEINEFNLRCRYPDDKYEIYKKATKTSTMKYFLYTQDLRKWILQKLK